MRGSAVSGAPTDGPSPGSSCSTSRRHAGLAHQRDGAAGDQRRLLGRLGDHGIAGHQRRGDLAGEDRQRKVPRRDADDDAARLGARLRPSPPRPRSSAGNRPPRALPPRRRPASCRPRGWPARRTRRHAPRRDRRRGAGSPRARPPAAPPRPAARRRGCRRPSATSVPRPASATVPTTSSGRAGLTTAALAPPAPAPGSSAPPSSDSWPAKACRGLARSRPAPPDR